MISPLLIPLLDRLFNSDEVFNLIIQKEYEVGQDKLFIDTREVWRKKGIVKYDSYEAEKKL